MLQVDGLHVHYGASHALRGVSLTARPGEVTCILGRNGVGKTTLLRAIMGHVGASSGRVSLDGGDITSAAPYNRARLGIEDIPAFALAHRQAARSRLLVIRMDLDRKSLAGEDIFGEERQIVAPADEPYFTDSLTVRGIKDFRQPGSAPRFFHVAPDEPHPRRLPASAWRRIGSTTRAMTS